MVAFSFAIVAHGVYHLSQSVAALERSTEHLVMIVDTMDKAQQSTHKSAIEESIKFAPEGFSIYQLRGFAQTQSQQKLDQLTHHYDIPRYQLNTVRFVPILRDGAAGTASSCHKPDGTRETSYTISYNEILYLRNYEVFMNHVIPHEVAHVIVCLRGGFKQERNESFWSAAHGEEWVEAMLVLGFLKPEDYRTHNLDMLPVAQYRQDFLKLWKEELEGLEIEYTGE